MIGNPIVSRFTRLRTRFRALGPVQPPKQPVLHTAWLHPDDLPDFVKTSPVARRYLDWLGPLSWDGLPERNLRRNWGQTAIPYASFIAAYFVKLNEGQDSLGDLRLFLTEHPALVWLLGFPLVVSNPGRLGFDANASLPTTRHLTRMLRKLPNAVLQFFLDDSVCLIREELAALGVQTGACISLDSKHIIAWVSAPRHGKLHCL